LPFKKIGDDVIAQKPMTLFKQIAHTHTNKSVAINHSVFGAFIFYFAS
jgi:hypothetical protein